MRTKVKEGMKKEKRISDFKRGGTKGKIGT